MGKPQGLLPIITTLCAWLGAGLGLGRFQVMRKYTENKEKGHKMRPFSSVCIEVKIYSAFADESLFMLTCQ